MIGHESVVIGDIAVPGLPLTPTGRATERRTGGGLHETPLGACSTQHHSSTLAYPQTASVFRHNLAIIELYSDL